MRGFWGNRQPDSPTAQGSVFGGVGEGGEGGEGGVLPKLILGKHIYKIYIHNSLSNFKEIAPSPLHTRPRPKRTGAFRGEGGKAR